MGGYLDSSPTPLFPFGHGLSYTEFTYSEARLDVTETATDGRVSIEVTVTNSGSRPGTEVVQAYAVDTAVGISRPAVQLVGFQAVDLAPGESSTVTFDVDARILAYLDLAGERWIVEAGPVEFRIGASSDDIRSSATVELIGETADVTDRRVFLGASRTEAGA